MLNAIMGNGFAINIDGYQVKELRCKNDECRALIGYENIKIGVFIFTCSECHNISIFKIGYNEAAKKFMDKLNNKFGKGGEIKNG